MNSKAQKRFRSNRLLVFGIVFIFASLACVFKHFAQQKIVKPSDLQTVEGMMSNYSFKGGYRGAQYYYIFLEGDAAHYMIPADFIGCFDKPGFESAVHRDDVLKLSFNKKRFVFSITDAKRSYLSTDSTIEIYNKSDIRIGLYMFLLGVAILVGRYFYNRRHSRGYGP